MPFSKRSFWWLSFWCCFHWLVPIKIGFQDIPNLAKHLSVMHFSQKFQWVLLLQGCFNIQNVIPHSCRRSYFWQWIFGVFPKRKGKILHASLLSYFLCFSHDSLHFAMIPLTPSATKTRILGSPTHSPRFGAKNEIHYSLLLFICHYSLLLFTPNFCLFKGGCPLYLNKCFVCLVQDFFLRESFHLRAFLCEISLLTITSYILYKPCNS